MDLDVRDVGQLLGQRVGDVDGDHLPVGLTLKRRVAIAYTETLSSAFVIALLGFAAF